MDLKPIQFALSADAGYSQRSNISNIVNLFAHQEPAGSKTSFILLNTEGYERIGVELIGEILGIYEFLGSFYIATDQKLYKNTNNDYDIVGSTYFSADKVYFADNGIELMVVGYQGYAYNPGTDTLTVMEGTTGWYHANTVAYMDGYFIFNRSGTGQFFISKLYSHEINPLDWATGEAAPDDTEAVVVSGRQLWLFGKRSTEVWYDSGDPLFPFTRVSGAVTDVGIGNYLSIATVHTTIFFVGEDGAVYATNGYTPAKMSTESVEIEIENEGIDSVLGFAYHNYGHYFYVLHIGIDTTMVYDLVTGLWHRRESNVLVTGSEYQISYNCSVDYKCNVKMLCAEVGDDVLARRRWGMNGAINVHQSDRIIGYKANKLFEVSSTIFTEEDIQITRSVVSLPLNKTVNRVTVAEVQLDMDAGGYTLRDGDFDRVLLQTSKDGGHTWGNVKESTVVQKGGYKSRAIWRRLGQSRDLVVRVILNIPTSIKILGLWVRS